MEGSTAFIVMAALHIATLTLPAGKYSIVEVRLLISYKSCYYSVSRFRFCSPESQ